MRFASSAWLLTVLISFMTAGFVCVVDGCATTSKAPIAPVMTKEQSRATPQTLEAAVNSEFRTPANKARDQYRHPLQTLTFFGVKNDMTIVEISPGGGWYAEILAPFLAGNGQYIAAENRGPHGGNKQFSEWMALYPQVAGKMSMTEFNPPDQTAIAPPGTADMVLTFRNVHNWMGKQQDLNAFKAFYKALKGGGTLGVVEHRQNPKVKQDPEAKSGYVTEDYVMKLAKKAGFKFVAKSEINANPKDTKDYPEGVWTLPPTYRLGDKDRDKYAAIGESDRMTLKFTKPKVHPKPMPY